MAYSSERSQDARRGFLDPRTKLALVLVLAVFVMGGLGGEALRPVKTVLSALPFALLLAERQWKRFARGIVMLGTGYGLLTVMPFLPRALNYLALLCGGILTRFVVTVVMGEYLIATTSVSEFISAMEHLHVPQAITIPMSVMFRLFPTISAECHADAGDSSGRSKSVTGTGIPAGADDDLHGAHRRGALRLRSYQGAGWTNTPD